MTLYEIDDIVKRCFRLDTGEAVDTDTGEIFDGTYLDNLEMDRDRKIRNIALWIKNLESDAEQLKAEAAAMNKRRTAKVNKANSLRKYLQKILDGEKVEQTEFKIGYRTTKDKVVFDDLSKVPGALFKSVMNFTPAEREKMVIKSEIKRMIKEGIHVPGAHLEDSVSMQIK